MNELISMTLLIALLIIVFFFIWYFKHRARSKERLLLIEKGIENKELNSITDKKVNFQWLRIGIVSTGIALGSIFVTLLMNSPTNLPLDRHFDWTFNFSVILLFAGISMIIANFVGGPKK
jgi:hypothetical protein